MLTCGFCGRLVDQRHLDLEEERMELKQAIELLEALLQRHSYSANLFFNKKTLINLKNRYKIVLKELDNG